MNNRTAESQRRSWAPSAALAMMWVSASTCAAHAMPPLDPCEIVRIREGGCGSLLHRMTDAPSASSGVICGQAMCGHGHASEKIDPNRPLPLPESSAVFNPAEFVRTTAPAQWSDEQVLSLMSATCFSAKNPPPPEVIEAVDRMVRAAVQQQLDRYHLASSWTGGVNAPVSLTWSFVPDGLVIPGSASLNEPAAASDLFDSMDSDFAFSPRSTWIDIFQKAFDRWGQLTGVEYTRVQYNGQDWDDGAAWGSTGVPGLRGDVRIGGHYVDGHGGVLAYNNFPRSGDMVIDTGEETWASYFRVPQHDVLFNVVCHEHGHGLGLQHVCPINDTKLMEPTASTAYVGPQHDDIRGAMSLYGDAYEPNGSDASATNLGTLAVGQNANPSGVPNLGYGDSYPPAGTTITAISGLLDEDYYRVTLLTGGSLAAIAIPVGLTYDNASGSASACPSGNPVNSLTAQQLKVDILAGDGATVLATATAPGFGGPALAVTGAVGTGTYYVRISAADGVAETQMYNFGVANNSAAAPPNDHCANAAVMAIGQTVTGVNVGATIEGTYTCVPTSSNDVWYRVTPACSGQMRLDTCGSAFDTVLTLWTGTCAGLTQVACNDDRVDSTCGEPSRSSFIEHTVTAGTQYYIRLAGYSNETGSFQLRCSMAAPANDLCGNALAVSPGNVYTGSNCGSGSDATASCASSSVSDVWYVYTPSVNHILNLSTCGSGFDTVLSVYTGSCAVLGSVACDDDFGGCGLGSQLSLPVTAGITYRIRVGGFQSGTGAFVLNVGASGLSNDNCATPTTITAGTYMGNNLFGTRDGVSTCNPSGTSPDVWYQYTAPCSGNLTIDTCGSSVDTVLALYSGTCGSLTQLACNDNGSGGPCGGTASYISAPVTAGTTYRIRVTGFGASTGMFNLHVVNPAATANDTCAGAMILGMGAGSVSDTTGCASRDGTSACDNTSTSGDLWYSYIAQRPGLLELSTCGASFDTVLSVYTGTCGATTQVACNDDAGAGACVGTLASYLAVPVNVGQGYLIRVSGLGSETGTFTLSIVDPTGPIDLLVPSQYPTIQAAVNAATSGDRVLLADGVYTGPGNRDVTLGIKNLTLASASDNPAACIVDCQGSARGLIIAGGQTASTRVQGLTIRNGATVAGNAGAGMAIVNSSPVIHKCRFVDNTCFASTSFGGGGIYLSGSSSAITNCVFSGNTAGVGAGVYATASSPTVLNCVFTDNTATLGGGGGMLTTGGTPLVRNCTLASNSAVRGGGLTLGTGVVTNTIVRGNTAPTLPDVEQLGGSITFSNLGLSFLSVTPNADGNFNADPLFFGPVARDFRLLVGSPCLERGNNSGVTAPPFPASSGSVPIDAAGRVRIQGARVDVGAYEGAFVNNDTCATATPIVNGTTTIDSRPANPDGLVTNCGMSGNSPALWYTYTATCTGTASISTCGSAFDTVLGVFTGACSGLTEVACNDDATVSSPCGSTTQSYLTFNAAAGTVYRIRVAGFQGAMGTGVLSVVCQAPCPPDFNGSGAVTVQDIFDFLNAYFANLATADFNNSGAVTVQDIFDYLAAYFAGC